MPAPPFQAAPTALKHSPRPLSNTVKRTAETKKLGAAGAVREQKAGGKRSQNEDSDATDGRARWRQTPRSCGAAAAPDGMHAAEADATTRQHPPERHEKPRTASTSDPRTHHWELRNGGGRSEEPGGRARCSQSLPPASFEPARKTAEGVRGRAAADCRAHWPRSMRKHSANRSAVADAGAGALGRKALDQGSTPPSSLRPNKTRAGARARGPRRKR